MIWVMMVALALGTALALLLPLIRARGAAGASVEAAEYDLRVYRDQLAEVEKDAERGTLPAEEAARARTEIARRVLEADRAREAATRAVPSGAPRAMVIAAGVAAIAAVTASFGLYAGVGAPGAPDQPIKLREAAANEIYASRPDQAAAEAKAALPAPKVPPELAEVLPKLRQAVADHPDDPEGLRLLADAEAATGDFHAAWQAQQKRIAVLGDKADAEDHAILAELMARAAGGLLTAAAEDEVLKALSIDPLNGRARFYAGLVLAQNGRPDKAFPVWRSLLEQGAQDAPWMPFVRDSITDLAWFAGEPNYQPPPPPAAADMAAVADMTPAERMQMIRNMVEGLNDKLASEGGPPGDWARLIGSLGVLGDKDRAAAIWGEAQTRFASDPAALSVVRQGAERAGLIEGVPGDPVMEGVPPTAAPIAAPQDAPQAAPQAAPQTTPLAGPDAQQMQDAAQMSPEDRQAMIEGMVAKLETRLMTEGGSPEEWERLFTTLKVLNAPDRAQAAWAKAQEAFAADPATLDRLRAAAQDAGVTP